MNLKIPYAFALLTMISGVGIAILFGINEDMFKTRIERGLNKNPVVQNMADEGERALYIKNEKDKNWRYYQRFHFHATGIGAMSLAALLLLASLAAPYRIVLITAYFISVAGFLYPFWWLMAAIYGPEMGRYEAKSAFIILGYSGGLYLVGLLMALYIVVRYRNKQ